MDEVLRDPTGYVVIGAEHPALGHDYWAYFDESEVNAPDYYGLTLDLNRASWAPVGWRTGEYLMGAVAKPTLIPGKPADFSTPCSMNAA